MKIASLSEDVADENSDIGLASSIEFLNLRPQTLYKLRVGIQTLEDLLVHSHSEITEATSLGTANTISKLVKSLGYSLTRKRRSIA